MSSIFQWMGRFLSPRFKHLKERNHTSYPDGICKLIYAARAACLSTYWSSSMKIITGKEFQISVCHLFLAVDIEERLDMRFSYFLPRPPAFHFLPQHPHPLTYVGDCLSDSVVSSTAVLAFQWLTWASLPTSTERNSCPPNLYFSAWFFRASMNKGDSDLFSVWDRGTRI